MLYDNKSEFIICGDININYLENSDTRQQLDAFLSTFILIGMVNFSSRILKDSRTAIDNIYIHKTRNYTINPVINGLSDHDAQMITMDSIMTSGQACNPQYIRNYSNFNINKFQEMLSYELWDDVFTNDNVNNILMHF
jgi:mitochondrial fission protein ELM1